MACSPQRAAAKGDTADLLLVSDAFFPFADGVEAAAELGIRFILQPGGSVEHYNKEPGAEWLQRMVNAWPKSVWLNPEPQASWQYRQSISLIRTIVQDRMFPVTVSGIEQAMRLLSK